MSQVSLFVDDMEHFGWTSVSVRKSLQALCGHFDLSLSPNWEQMPIDWKAKPGQKCTLELSKTRVLTGFIDSFSESISANSRTIRVTGRDITSDLCDCYSTSRKRTWPDAKFEAITRSLISPYGLELDVQCDTGRVFNAFAIQDETIFSALDRAAKLRGLILYTNGDGEIVVTKPNIENEVQGILEEKKHILDAEVSKDYSNRFSEYTMRIMNTGAADKDEANLRPLAPPVLDPVIKRNRVLSISPEGYAQAQNASQRLNWEKSVRAAKSEKITVSIPQWTNADGLPWELNKLVTLEIPSLNVIGDYLVTGITFSLDASSGTRTTLECEKPEAYIIDPTLEIKENTRRDLIAKESKPNA